MSHPVIVCLLAMAATLPAMLAHELGRGLAALLLTRGRVCVLLGAGRPLAALRVGRLTIGPAARPWSLGECLHAPTASPRRTLAVLVAGPLAADLCFVLAGAGAVRWEQGALEHPAAQLALWVFALACLARATLEIAGYAGHRRFPIAAR
jgi:hypothetical protein